MTYTEDEVRQMLRDKIEVEYGSQSCFAEAHGFTQSWISKVLLGKQPPTERLANALGLTRIVSFSPCNPEKQGA